MFLLFGGTEIVFSEGDKIASCHTRKKYEITELGIMHPEEVPTGQLLPGQVGYIACNMKQSSEGKILYSARFACSHAGAAAHIGDTLHHIGDSVEPMPGFQPAKAMVCSTPQWNKNQLI